MNEYGLDFTRSPKEQSLLNSQTKRIDRVFRLKTIIGQSQIEIECFLQKNQLYMKRDLNGTLCINLDFWSVFQKPSAQVNDHRFILYVNASESYIFFARNFQQLNQFKQKYSRIGLLRGFYQDFKPIQKLGQGKMASVFLAVNRLSEEKVAIKAFSKKYMLNDPLSTSALRNQIEILKGVNHQSLLKFKRFYETEKSYYAVTEYIEGQTLRNLIETQQLSFSKILHILRRIVEGLDYLASKGIAHRDIKPDNIIVGSRYDNIVIVDFGLAVYCRNSSFLYTHCGTPGFVAPQIIDEGSYKISPKADIFSLGVTLHLMLLKKFPYKNTSIDNILDQNREAQFEFRSEQYKAVNPEGIKLMQKMLVKDYRSRISAAELLRYLDQRQNWLNAKRFYPRLEEIVLQNPEDKKEIDKKILVRSSSLKLNFRGRIEKIY